MIRPRRYLGARPCWLSRVAVGAGLVSAAVSLVSCSGKSLAAADDAIRSLDDIVRAGDNVADDFARTEAFSIGQLQLYLRSSDDAAAAMQRSIQTRVIEVQAVEPSVTESKLRDVSCAVADFYLKYSEWPDVPEIEDYTEDLFQVQSSVVAEAALEIVQDQARESFWARDFAGVVATACQLTSV